MVGNNHVVVGGFENRPEFLNKEPLFRLRLEGSDNLYFATNNQIRKLEAEMDPILEPVVELSRSGFLIDYPRWSYVDENGETVDAQADMVDIHQILIDYGDRYIRTARYCFMGLWHRYHGEDWVLFTMDTASDIICPLGTHGGHSALYVVEDEYTSLRSAKHAMGQEDYFNYQNICRELFQKN